MEKMLSQERVLSQEYIEILDVSIIEEEGTPDEVFGNPKSEKTKMFLSAGFNK